MKELKLINNYLGFFKKSFIIEGWGNMGQIAHPCATEEEAKEIKKEYEVEDDARCVIKEGLVFVKIFKVGSDAHLEYEIKKTKRKIRKQGEYIPEYKVILYSWDGSVLAHGLVEELSPIIKILGPGDKLVAWDKNNNKETIIGGFLPPII